MNNSDTIAAIATAPGQGGIGVIRVSGAEVQRITKTLLSILPQPRFAKYVNFKDTDNEVIDQGIALFFSKPDSFTGEDVLELQGHGGPVVLNQLLNRVIELGARPARAGEFSERAYLNNKIDLAQAEAIADLIAAESEQSAKAAMHSLQGEFSITINLLVEELIQLRVHVESALDFPEEEIDFLADKVIEEKLSSIQQQVLKVEQGCKQGALLREGARVVITGKPNVGKSSLLNQLAGLESAIVSDVPGTTRDVLREHIQIEGIPLHIVDTAGLRDSSDEVEQEGVRRAQKEIEQADIVLHMLDANTEELIENEKNNQLVIYNKVDLTDLKCHSKDRAVWISAKTGEGIDNLKQLLLQIIGATPASQQEGLFSARTRHVDAIKQTEQHLELASDALHDQQAGEIMAEELRLAQNELSSITGEFSSDDLLGKIFSEFCIGK